jgi:hypothetical protein
VVFGQHEASDFTALRLAFRPALSADDHPDFHRDHVPVRMHGHQEAAPLEGEADTTT